MQIAIAQINPTVGDLMGNTRKIVDRIQEAKRKEVDLIVFPEMSITGYPPRDLLLYKAFIRQAEESVYREILPIVEVISVILGAPWQEETEDTLFNSALLLQDKKLVSCHHKTLLPHYDVFDESRYFVPAPHIWPATINGRKLAITVCEDIWNDSDYFAHSCYSQDPVAKLFQQGAEILINISASPYHLEKTAARVGMLTSLAGKYRAGVIYANQVGGNDELIFDGSSMACSPEGELVSRAQPFTEELIVIDTDTWSLPASTRSGEDGPRAVMEQPVSDKSDGSEVNCELEMLPGQGDGDMDWVLAALKLGLKDYLDKNGFTRVAVGLSGGIDSALVAAIAVEALGAQNVLGVIMPSRYSSEHSVRDAQQLADNLGMEARTISIEEPYNQFIELLNSGSQMQMDLAEENLQARLRGNILMFISNREGWMVLPTGNKSELAVGYCTLYGDMCGGLAVIADLPKMMVYRLSVHINSRFGRELIPTSIIEKPPSAELRPDQTDQDSLPPYEILDEILHHYIEENRCLDEIVSLGYDSATVSDVISKVDRSEYKRNQAAPGLRITTRAFGSGRRIPTAKPPLWCRS